MKNGGARTIPTSAGTQPARSSTAAAPGWRAIPAENRAPLIGDAQGGLICAVDGRIVDNTFSDELRRRA